MNKKGFTLIELLGTLVILGIIMGITIVSMSGVMSNAKDKSEEAFLNTLEDAIGVYLNSDGRNAKYGSNAVCTLNKAHKKGNVNVYMASTDKRGGTITFNTIINSLYSPIEAKDLINPSNKEDCGTNTIISLYKDDDGVYYYKFSTENWECLNSNAAKKIVTDLPCDCLSDNEKKSVESCK